MDVVTGARSMGQRFLRVVWGVLLVLMVGLAYAADPVRLVYGADRAFAPFEFQDGQGNPQGFQIELLRELERAGGLNFEIRQDEWRAIEAGFRAGRIDLVAMTETRSRREWAMFVRPHATPATGIYHRPETRSPVALADLAGRVVAMEAGSEPMRHTRETFLAGGEFRFLLVPDLKAAFEAVRDGRADYVMTARAYGDELLSRGAAQGVSMSEVSLRLQAYGFAVAPGNDLLRQRLEGLLEQLERSGRLEALRLKWLSSHRDAAARADLERRVLQENILLGATIVLAGGAVIWLVIRLRIRLARLRAERARRQAAERDLAGARQKLEHAFTRHPDAMMVTADGSVVEANDAFCRMFGRARDEVVGQRLEALPAFATSGVMAVARGPLEEHGYFENVAFEWQRGDGMQAYFLISGRRIETGATPEVFSIVREVSADVRKDAALRQEFEALAAAMRAQSDELGHARAQARQSDEALQGFTESVSHDLRAPLRAIGGFSGLLRGDLDEGNIEAAISNVRQIENAVERMGSMLEGLARLSRIGRTPLQRAPVEMAAEAARAWKLVTSGREPAAISLRIAPMPAASADPVLVGQVWQNLLENAFKFTARAAQPTIAVDAHVEGGVTWFRVADNGAGFDMRYAQQLFQPFQRMHAQREFAGTGVGLSIVRRIAQAHGGDVRARSSPGVGTVIEFSLAPARTAPD